MKVLFNSLKYKQHINCLSRFVGQKRVLKRDISKIRLFSSQPQKTDNTTTTTSTTTNTNKLPIEWPYHSLRPKLIEADHVLEAIRNFDDDANQSESSRERAQSIFWRTMLGYEGWVVPAINVDTERIQAQPGAHVPLKPSPNLCLLFDEQLRQANIFTNTGLLELWLTPERLDQLMASSNGTFQRKTQLVTEHCAGLRLFSALLNREQQHGDDNDNTLVAGLKMDGSNPPEFGDNNSSDGVAALRRTFNTVLVETAAAVLATPGHANDRIHPYRQRMFKTFMQLSSSFFVLRPNRELAQRRPAMQAFTDKHLLLDTARAALGDSTASPEYDEVDSETYMATIASFSDKDNDRLLLLNADTPIEQKLSFGMIKTLYNE